MDAGAVTLEGPAAHGSVPSLPLALGETLLTSREAREPWARAWRAGRPGASIGAGAGSADRPRREASAMATRSSAARGQALGAPAAASLDAALARLAEGEREAFHQVFQALWPIVRSYCARSLSGSADAEDAAQRVMEKIFSEASRYDPERPALAWALTIAAWECRSVRRRAQRRREDELSAAAELRAPGHGPEQEVELRQLVEAAEEVLSRLAPHDREAILAAVLEDVRIKAEVSAPTLRKRRERALARFKQLWRSVYGRG